MVPVSMILGRAHAHMVEFGPLTEEILFKNGHFEVTGQYSEMARKEKP